MRLEIFLGFLLPGLASSGPTAKDEEQVINQDFFSKLPKVYEGQHDIVKIYPLINKDDEELVTTLFFVAADINGTEVIDQGLYVRKGGNITKLLDHGRDIAAPQDNSNTAYFATMNGLYKYNSIENKAEKYGTINEDLIGITMMNSTDGMYVLYADKKVYKVSEDGNKEVFVENIINAEQIVLDCARNLFYVDSEKRVYVVNDRGTKQIEGLPKNFSKITLIRPPLIFEEGIPIVVDKEVYTVYANGTGVRQDFVVIDTDITAYAVDAVFIQYYGTEKNIYEFKVDLSAIFKRLTVIMESLAETFKMLLSTLFQPLS